MSLSLTNRLMNKVVIVAKIKVMYVVNMNFHSARLIWLLLLLLSTRSTSSKDHHHLNGPFYMAPFPGVIRQYPGIRLFVLDHFHHGKNSTLPSLLIDLPFLNVMLLHKP